MAKKVKKVTSTLLTRTFNYNEFILGIDPSLSSTGLCLIDRMGSIADSSSFGSKRTGPARLVQLRDHLADYLEKYRPSVCAIEGYSFGSKHAREVVAEWGGTIRVMLWERSIPTLVVPPMTLKKFVLTDMKNLAKDRMAVASYARWGVSFKNDDECDAHALAQLALVRLSYDGCLVQETSFTERMASAALSAACLG